MRVLRFAIMMVALYFALSVIRLHSQSTPSQTAPSTPSKPAWKSPWGSNRDKPQPPPPPPPELEHFDLNLIDKTLDPCQDFYAYACSKWNAANPIPKDQAAWTTGGGLEYWNEAILREVLQKAAAQTGNSQGERTASRKTRPAISTTSEAGMSRMQR